MNHGHESLPFGEKFFAFPSFFTGSCYRQTFRKWILLTKAGKSRGKNNTPDLLLYSKNKIKPNVNGRKSCLSENFCPTYKRENFQLKSFLAERKIIIVTYLDLCLLDWCVDVDVVAREDILYLFSSFSYYFCVLFKASRDFVIKFPLL